jgi:hypothetical protein
MAKMLPELRRAIMKFVPDYFSWNEKTQEEYRVRIPEEVTFNIRKFLMAELFGIAVNNEEEMDEAEGHFTEAQWRTINGAMLPLQGIGENYFFLNESFARDQSILSFPTLYDYDFADYQFQEEWRKKDIADYQGKPYHGSLYSTWARLQIDGTFSYAILSMQAAHINSETDEFGHDYIEKLIPYEFKPGKNHGKREKGGYLFNMIADANGLEAQLKELQRRFWSHLQKTHEQLQIEFSKASRRQVFIIDTSREDDPTHQFIFTDREILSHIGLKTFLVDCRKYEQRDYSILVDRIEKEKKLMQQFLIDQHADIMADFNDKVIKLTKKRRVIIHKDSGLAGLLD